jgi:hypothetical protein
MRLKPPVGQCDYTSTPIRDFHDTSCSAEALLVTLNQRPSRCLRTTKVKCGVAAGSPMLCDGRISRRR